ncbi:hypothetical protein F2P79_005182 [Pimephales promelas]|nr:hypothetical protein F2P79_005182 [Pimephales promelas]
MLTLYPSLPRLTIMTRRVYSQSLVYRAKSHDASVSAKRCNLLLECHIIFPRQTLYCVEPTGSRHIRRLLHGSEFVQIVMWT